MDLPADLEKVPDNKNHETFSLSPTQEHAVLKDAELSPLVPATSAASAATDRRDRGGVALCYSCWPQPPASSAVATLPLRERSRVSNNYNDSSNNHNNSE